MCFNGRFIRNKYTNRRFWVSCGHCPACLQQKANKRMSRIYNEYTPEHSVLFVTLTYNRDSCPYIRVNDLVGKPLSLNVYRDVKLVRTFGGSKVVNESEILATINLPNYDSLLFDKLTGNPILPSLAFRSHNIGVCYFKDFQDFMKRFKQCLTRNFNYNGYFKSYQCSEYGEVSKRPHFHCLFFFEKGFERQVRDSILQAWPFASKSRLLRGIEKPIDATSYVASYVNSPSDFPKFLADNFAPEHSFSKAFGFNIKSFQLFEVLSKVESGDMRYLKQVSFGEPPVNIPLPKYVINRYFPYFKGYSRLDSSKVLDYLLHPDRLRESKAVIDYTDEEIRKIAVKLSNVYFRYFFPSYSYIDYCILYNKAWIAYRSTLYRNLMEDHNILSIQKYDNLYEIQNGSVINTLGLKDTDIINPNEFLKNVSDTNYLTQLFAKKVKTKKVSDIVVSKI